MNGKEAMNHEETLRRVLEAEADRVEVRPDALTVIRGRIAARGSWWARFGRPFLFGSGVAAALAGATAAVVVAAGVLDGPPQVAPPEPGASVTGAPWPPAPSGPPVGTASPRPTDPTGQPADPGRPAAVAVYYVGVDKLTREDGAAVNRPRLYREFHRLPVGDGGAAARTRTAVGAMLGGRAAADPDYASPWPAGARLNAVSVDAGTVTVDLSGAATNPVDAETARIAVQQLVWTATAASGRTGVRLLLDGRPADRLWGQVAAGGVLRRGAGVEVLGPVWLIDPQHGATVGRSFEVHVAGTVFEAIAHLRVRRGSQVVVDQPVQLSAGPPAQGQARVRLTLPPGSYVVEAYEASAADGTPQHVDDHTITVR